MLSCSDVTRLCASEEVRRTPFGTRLALRLHLLMCRHCRRYVRELAAIGVAAREAFGLTRETSSDTSALEHRILAEVRRSDVPPREGD